MDPQIEVYKRLKPRQRLAAAVQLYCFTREIIKQRIKSFSKNISKAELEKKIREQM